MPRTSRNHRLILASAGCILLLTSPATPHDGEPSQRAQTQARTPSSQGPSERRAALLRATVIQKIAPYMTTPRLPKASPQRYRIAVVGNDLLADAIRQKLPSKKVGKRAIMVRTLDPVAASKVQTRTFDLLYIAASVDPATVRKIVASHKKLATTLVCERPGFAKSGGGLQLFVKSNKIRFEINKRALKSQGIRVSPQLMKLSTKGPRK